MTEPNYFPILKGKEGEFAALEMLHRDDESTILPIIEIPSIPYDYTNERPAKSLDDHLRGIGDKLARCWSTDQPVGVDVSLLGGDPILSDGTHALARVLIDCATAGVNAYPVFSFASSPSHLAAVQAHSQANGRGGILRTTADDFADDRDVEATTRALLSKIGSYSAEELIFLVDLRHIQDDTSRDLILARYMLSSVPSPEKWRALVVAAASFPEDLSDVDASSTQLLERWEWTLWSSLRRVPSRLPRPDVKFGDYAIAHPVPRELDPRTMRMSASIRYTTETDWLVLKGRNVRQHGFEQYHDLCKELLTRSEYQGEEFSWADKYIALCARRETGPGNATTWRKVGTNHHLTLVSRLLAKQFST